MAKEKNPASSNEFTLPQTARELQHLDKLLDVLERHTSANAMASKAVKKAVLQTLGNIRDGKNSLETDMQVISKAATDQRAKEVEREIYGRFPRLGKWWDELRLNPFAADEKENIQVKVQKDLFGERITPVADLTEPKPQQTEKVSQQAAPNVRQLELFDQTEGLKPNMPDKLAPPNGHPQHKETPKISFPEEDQPSKRSLFQRGFDVIRKEFHSYQLEKQLKGLGVETMLPAIEEAKKLGHPQIVVSQKVANPGGDDQMVWLTLKKQQNGNYELMRMTSELRSDRNGQAVSEKVTMTKGQFLPVRYIGELLTGNIVPDPNSRQQQWLKMVDDADSKYGRRQVPIEDPRIAISKQFAELPNLIDYGKKIHADHADKIAKGQQVELTLVQNGAPVRILAAMDKRTGELQLKDHANKLYLPGTPAIKEQMEATVKKMGVSEQQKIRA